MTARGSVRDGLAALLALATFVVGGAVPVGAQNEEELPLVPIILSEPETIASGPLPGAESVTVGVANAVPVVPVVEPYPVPVTAPAPQPQGPAAPPPPPAAGLTAILPETGSDIDREVTAAIENLLGLNQPAAEPVGPTICFNRRISDQPFPC